MVFPLREIILFSTTNFTNFPISLASGIFFPRSCFSNFFKVKPSFFIKLINLFVLIGPGAILINLIFFLA